MAKNETQSPKVLIVHGAVPKDASPDEQDVLIEVAAVEAALRRLGYATATFGLTLDLARASRCIAEFGPQIVFNLVESVGGRGRYIHLGPTLFEELGLVYTGVPLVGTFLTSNKLTAKELLVRSNIATPAWIRDDLSSPTRPSSGPWLVKSVWEHASIGLDEEAVVHDPARLEALFADRRRRLGGEWFAEAYVPGREFNISILTTPSGPRVLPLAEIVFDGYAPEEVNIVGYRAKWVEDSPEYQRTRRVFLEKASTVPFAEEMRKICTEVWSLFCLQGYARVDFRVDPAGRPWVLEVNSNPCLTPDAGFAAAANQAGISFDELIETLIADAVARHRHRVPAPLLADIADVHD